MISSHFKSDPNQFQTVPDETVTDRLQFQSGPPLILHWGRTDSPGLDFHSQWMDPETGELTSVSTQLPMHSKELPMEL